jgi:hypothetical protein
MMEPVTTAQIYWGAVPFVLIQIIMVGVIIAFPGIVSRDKEEKIDLDKVKIEMRRRSGGRRPQDLVALEGAHVLVDLLELGGLGFVLGEHFHRRP